MIIPSFPKNFWRGASAIAGAALLLSASRALATGGDIESIKFSAAAPFTYNHDVGGGAYNDGTVGDHADITQQLEGGQFACGDIVSFFVKVKMSASPVEANQGIRVKLSFLADTTGSSGAALSEVVGVRVNYGAVENGDSGTGVNPGAGVFGTDSGINDDGGSTVTLVSQQLTGPLFVSGSKLVTVFEVSDLEAGESVVVRVDCRLACKSGSGPTGNLQGDLESAESLPSNDTVQSGLQTLPFLKAGEILGANSPLLKMEKTVGFGDATYGSNNVEELTVDYGTQVKYFYKVSNVGTQPLFDLTLSDDAGTTNTTADDFQATFVGLPEIGGDTAIGDLESGATVVGTALVTLTNTGTIVNTAVASGNNGRNGGNYAIFTASDKATVNVQGLPPCPISCASDVIVEAGQSVDPSVTGSATSECSTVVFSDSISVGTCPAVQVVTRTWTASGEGRPNNTCTQTITVRDTTAPVITTPTVPPLQLSLGSCSAAVNYAASATDNWDTNVTLAYNPASGSTFPVGTTRVDVTATDACGNSSTNSFNVQVLTAVCGTKFYDSNVNGVQDGTEAGIAGWKVRLTDSNGNTQETVTDASGKYCFTNFVAGAYTVSEVIPMGAWKQTTDSSVPLTLSCPQAINFGSVSLGAGGGLTLGYWSNNNGQNSMTKTGGGMSANLAFLTGLNLRDNNTKNPANLNGNPFDPSAYTAFRSWLVFASADNMSYMLSVQMAAMQLNVRLAPVKDSTGVQIGGVNGNALIYAPGVNCANAAGFASVNALMAEANAELSVHGLVLTGSPYRAYEEALKNAFNSGNNNLNFVQPIAGSVSY